MFDFQSYFAGQPPGHPSNFADQCCLKDAETRQPASFSLSHPFNKQLKKSSNPGLPLASLVQASTVDGASAVVVINSLLLLKFNAINFKGVVPSLVFGPRFFKSLPISCSNPEVPFFAAK